MSDLLQALAAAKPFQGPRPDAAAAADFSACGSFRGAAAVPSLRRNRRRLPAARLLFPGQDWQRLHAGPARSPRRPIQWSKSRLGVSWSRNESHGLTAFKSSKQPAAPRATPSYSSVSKSGIQGQKCCPKGAASSYQPSRGLILNLRAVERRASSPAWTGEAPVPPLPLPFSPRWEKVWPGHSCPRAWMYRDAHRSVRATLWL